MAKWFRSIELEYENNFDYFTKRTYILYFTSSNRIHYARSFCRKTFLQILKKQNSNRSTAIQPTHSKQVLASTLDLFQNTFKRYGFCIVSRFHKFSFGLLTLTQLWIVYLEFLPIRLVLLVCVLKKCCIAWNIDSPRPFSSSFTQCSHFPCIPLNLPGLQWFWLVVRNANVRIFLNLVIFTTNMYWIRRKVFIELLPGNQYLRWSLLSSFVNKKCILCYFFPSKHES